MLWLCVALWGWDEDPGPVLLALPVGAGRAEGCIRWEGGCSLEPFTLASAAVSRETPPRNRGFQGEEVAIIVDLLPLTAALFSS